MTADIVANEGGHGSNGREDRRGGTCIFRQQTTPYMQITKVEIWRQSHHGEYPLEIKHKQRCKSKEGMMLNSNDHRKDTIE